LLGARGWNVAVGYHSGDEEARDVVEIIERFGSRAVAIGGDLSQESDVRRSLSEAQDAFGPLTGCVINAGVQAKAAFPDMELSDWCKVTSLDLDGSFLLAREFVRQLPEPADREGIEDKRPPRGSIVFMTSVHAHIPWANYASYAAAKGGVTMLMKTVAQEMGAVGVRANAVAPGAIKTPINENVWGDEDSLKKLLELIPAGRLGMANEVAEAVEWLLGDKSHYVTGQTLTIDGGMSLYPGFIGNG
jgi:glucose 1-dehydrogenase